MILSDLYKAYLNTSYNVIDPPLSIHINEFHPKLDELLEQHQCETWAFITAFNPYSKILLEEENLRRHQMLVSDLSNFKLFEGVGAGKESSWNPERSVLVLNISLEEAIRMGKKYEQNAIVTGKKNSVAELTILI
jgi:hypothetical protein